MPRMMVFRKKVAVAMTPMLILPALKISRKQYRREGKSIAVSAVLPIIMQERVLGLGHPMMKMTMMKMTMTTIMSNLGRGLLQEVAN
ncbi:unnamed protein product [Linum tenue]|uniref:Uncharacterized protein n=1 Tax=Linum tenue TaxID=586396 RepID=A0AAV0KU01_9ROSI|nr:unnamed protein product [Linum tenue]